jgi:hypothetical protein
LSATLLAAAGNDWVGTRIAGQLKAVDSIYGDNSRAAAGGTDKHR